MYVLLIPTESIIITIVVKLLFDSCPWECYSHLYTCTLIHHSEITVLISVRISKIILLSTFIGILGQLKYCFTMYHAPNLGYSVFINCNYCILYISCRVLFVCMYRLALIPHLLHTSVAAIMIAPTNPMSGPPRHSPAIPPATAPVITLKPEFPGCSPLPVPGFDYNNIKINTL